MICSRIDLLRDPSARRLNIDVDSDQELITNAMLVGYYDRHSRFRRTLNAAPLVLCYGEIF